MNRLPKIRIALIAALFMLAAPAAVLATSDRTELLVTFDNTGAKNAPVNTHGRAYRYRTRYAVSKSARAQANATRKDYDLEVLDDWPIDSLQIYCVVFRAASADIVDDLIEALRADPRVESVQRMMTFSSSMQPDTAYNDTYVGLQHGLRSMAVAAAHRYATGQGVTIAVVDTGIDGKHEDLSNNTIDTVSFVDDRIESHSYEHGTAVVSLIAAHPNNGRGIVGIAPAAELRSTAACWATEEDNIARCNSFTLAKAMDHVLASPPDILNLSIAGPYDPLFGRLIQKAIGDGTVVIAARPAGDEDSPVYPANYPGVLGVRSGQHDTDLQLQSGGGVAAPGEHIMVALTQRSIRFSFRQFAGCSKHQRRGRVTADTCTGAERRSPEKCVDRIATGGGAGRCQRLSRPDGDRRGRVVPLN